MDDVTWQALGLTLTLIGVAISYVLWRRRGLASGTRALAWSLLPLAAALTGVLALAWGFVDDILGWATRLLFSPTVWLGCTVAAVAGVLFVVSGFLRARGIGGTPRPRSANPTAVPGTQPRRALSKSTSAPSSGDDLSDIEEILRRRGIK